MQLFSRSLHDAPFSATQLLPIALRNLTLGANICSELVAAVTKKGRHALRVIAEQGKPLGDSDF